MGGLPLTEYAGVVNPDTLDPSGNTHASEPELRAGVEGSTGCARSADGRRLALASVFVDFFSTPDADTVEMSARRFRCLDNSIALCRSLRLSSSRAS